MICVALTMSAAQRPLNPQQLTSTKRVATAVSRHRAMKRYVRGSELQEGITVVAPLSPSIATMLTLMLSKFHAERAYKNKGKPKKLCTGVVGALINKRFSSAVPKYNVCHDSR